MSGTNKRRLVGRNVGNGIANDEDYESDGAGHLKLRYSASIWSTNFFVMLIFILAAATLAVVVFHYRHDADSYVCNEDDRDRWHCNSVFEADTDDCVDMSYRDWATGGTFQMCYFDICIYFKDWGPMDAFPCFGGELYPEAGKDHCLDFIDRDNYTKWSRLETVLFCLDDSTAVCVYRDACSHYGVIDTDSEVDEESTKLNGQSLSQSVLDRLAAMNGTGLYVYGSQQAVKNSPKRWKNAPIR